MHAPSRIWTRDPSTQAAKTYALDIAATGTDVKSYTDAKWVLFIGLNSIGNEKTITLSLL
jgi:hypothetical protein